MFQVFIFYKADRETPEVQPVEEKWRVFRFVSNVPVDQ
jgi:hypothetical protein